MSEQSVLESQFKGSSFLEDIDTVQSPRNGAIVVIAMRGGAHVCWQCGELFGAPSHPQIGPVEKLVGEVPVLVHAKCVFYQPKIFVPMRRAMQKAQELGARKLERIGKRIGILPR